MSGTVLPGPGPGMGTDQLLDRLCALELDPSDLRRDPRGRSWLPADLQDAIRGSQALEAELAAFVSEELALFDDAALPETALFTARVMAQIPDEGAQGIDPARRRSILAFAYGGAGLVAAMWVLNARLALGSADAVIEDSWHAWIDLLSMGGVALVAAMVVTTGALLWPTAAPAARARG